jgi:hypothetical protein
MSKRVKRGENNFEFWLLLHFGFTSRSDLPDSSTAKAAVKTALGEVYGPLKR